MAIDARDRGRVARFAVKHAVAMNIDIEVAVSALHAVREMHIFQVHGFCEFFRIVVVDRVVVEIEQVAFAIVFENRAKDPAVPMVVGELGVLELRI